MRPTSRVVVAMVKLVAVGGVPPGSIVWRALQAVAVAPRIHENSDTALTASPSASPAGSLRSNSA